MPPIFTPRANLVARGTLFVLASIIVGGALLWYAFARSAYVSDEGITIWQPVPFSHAHHAGGLGIDCRYCHTTVERTASAGMPSTDICMNCHWQLWTETEALAPIRASWREGSRIIWNRVYDLPDFVYFDHSVHVQKGVSCYTCHGDVDRMPLVYKATSLFMEWCLDCHRNPQDYLDPRQAILTRNELALADGPGLEPANGVHRFDLRGLTDCTACHR